LIVSFTLRTFGLVTPGEEVPLEPGEERSKLRGLADCLMDLVRQQREDQGLQ
jgi:hypothetical protein